MNDIFKKHLLRFLTGTGIVFWIGLILLLPTTSMIGGAFVLWAFFFLLPMSVMILIGILSCYLIGMFIRKILGDKQ